MMNRLFIGLVFMTLVAVSAAQSLTEKLPQVPSTWMPLAGPIGTVRFEARFDSPITTGYAENDTVPLLVTFPKTDLPVPVVLILHYWGATDLKVENELAARLAQKGIGSAVITLPYHLTRAPAGTKSGALAITADPNRLLKTMTQAALDTRRAIDVLETRPEIDKSRIGITGISLGAIVSSLVIGVEPRIQNGALLLGGADLTKIIWTSSRVVAEREGLRRAGYTEDSVREILKPVEPLTYLKDRKDGRFWMLTARYDTVVPKQASDALRGALPNCQSTMLETGHYGGFFIQNQLLKNTVSFFDREFRGEPYVAQRQLRSPTLRIGGSLANGQGFDINLGIDLLKRNSDRAPFVSLMATPQRFQLFLGQSVEKSLSVGIFLAENRVNAGLLWSIVL